MPPPAAVSRLNALPEDMIDLVVNRDDDIVSMPLGVLPALDDGANTISDPALADKVLSVGAGISRKTWAADHGSRVTKPYGLFLFSSHGPAEDGRFTPNAVAPGSAVSTIPSRMPGDQAYEEGTGLIDVPAAWKQIRAGVSAHEYTVKAPVDTALAPYLSPALGSLTPDASGPVRLGTGASTMVPAHVTVTVPSAQGRSVFGEVRLVIAVGRGTVRIGTVPS
ncbi:hypothetical protein [Streptomyces sp. 4F14]|uniref:hypothetical protein n=1 Tax=Streptomyces sp. 4F14 TaxID=3394380 RepID=UPI003A89D5A9